LIEFFNQLSDDARKKIKLKRADGEVILINYDGIPVFENGGLCHDTLVEQVLKTLLADFESLRVKWKI